MTFGPVPNWDSFNVFPLEDIDSHIGNGVRLFHVHIPKTGGTSLNRVLQHDPLFLNGGHCFAQRGMRAKGHKPAEGRIWPTFSDKGFNPDLDKCISVVRNPYAWLYSYFNHIGARYWGLKKHYGWQGCVGYHKFESFADFVFHYCYGSGWHCPNLQSSMIGQYWDGRKFVNITYLLRTEDLDQLMPLFASRTGLKRVVNGHYNRGQSSSYTSQYTDEMKLAVENKFSGFMEKFGYNFEGVSQSQAKLFAAHPWQ